MVLSYATGVAHAAYGYAVQVAARRVLSVGRWGLRWWGGGCWAT